MDKNELPEKIDQDELIISEDDEMPEPETKNYEQTLKPTSLFYDLFNEAVGNMKYATILTNQQNNSIKLIDLVHFVEAKKEKGFGVAEMNNIISFIACGEFKNVRPLMEIIDNKEKQSILWTIE